MEITGLVGDSYFRFSHFFKQWSSNTKNKMFLELTFVVEQAVFRQNEPPLPPYF